jgi:DNA polymerase delta subunit 1
MSLDQRGTKVSIDKKDDIVFQAVSWYAQDIDFSEIDNEEDASLDYNKYVIKCFGSTINGQTVSVTIKDFTPYFYVKISDTWGTKEVEIFKEFLYTKLPYKLSNAIISMKILHRKDFWGFTNEKKFKFIRICLRNQKTMRILAKLLSSECQIRRISSKPTKFKVYESNIDPYIRFMHINNIEPCGWIQIPGNTYTICNEIMPSTCQIDVEVHWSKVAKFDSDDIAPFVVASFDIECSSMSGDFPVPKKDYRKVASDLYELFTQGLKTEFDEYKKKEAIIHSIKYAIGIEKESKYGDIIRQVEPKSSFKASKIVSDLNMFIDDFFIILSGKNIEDPCREKIIAMMNKRLSEDKLGLPTLKGDPIIQIGTTFHKFGEKECCYRHIITVGSCDMIEGADVEQCETEEELLIRWRDMIKRTNPDAMIGFNIFGFDMVYMHERADDLGIQSEFMKGVGRFQDIVSAFKETKLSSSALGDNILKFIDMEGRVLIDIMKVVQRDHKLDSYKLDNVAHHFMGQNKHDVSPADIIRLQKGSSADRKVIAEYCIQDCMLCNHLTMKLEILANNMGMANVCLVPLSFIFMRGQGIKIFSLVLKECKEDGYLIPVVKAAYSGPPPWMTQPAVAPKPVADDDGYEGAIVLEPKEGIYIDEPVAVLDYASLYPSSMISENLSHDCIVLDKQYDNLPGVEYLDISYDIYEGMGDKKVKSSERVCRYVQYPDGKKGIIPSILMKLLKARKTTRKKMELSVVKMLDGITHRGIYNEDTGVLTFPEGGALQLDKNEIESVDDFYNDFQKAVLDGMQNAYKVTANSLYGQIGARTSPIYLKDIAACTTATGRKMILMAKDFLEKNYNANIVYGDTDSIFVVFPNSVFEPTDDISFEQMQTFKGKSKIMPSIAAAIKASGEFKHGIKAPHDLEYEKTFWPFVLLSKKRYVGNVYEKDDRKCKQKSMGIVLKRRDNAPIVKRIYGGIIDIILGKQNVQESIDFLTTTLKELVDGTCPLEDLIISKSLRAEYKDPTRIAHKVLAERIGQRDPGNKPQVNDRIPFVYICPPQTFKSKVKVLQGNRIEHPDFIRKNKIKPDYAFYITNQIMKPVLQVYGVIAEQVRGNKHGLEFYQIQRAKLMAELKDEKRVKDKISQMKEEDVQMVLFNPILTKLENIRNKNKEITEWFKPLQRL